MNTYQAFYINEVRALEIDINDQTGADFSPSAAYVTVQNSSGSVVVAEQAAQVSGSQVRTLIGTTTTATVGEYKVIWRILYGGYTYYHVTDLEIMEL